MIDKDKVRLMTKISIYEKNEENKSLVISKYYNEDYIKYNCLKTIVTSSICYWMIVAVYVMIRFQEILKNINTMDYLKTVSLLMVGYISFVAVFVVAAFLIYTYRYAKVKPGLIEYNKNLKRYIDYDRIKKRESVRRENARRSRR